MVDKDLNYFFLEHSIVAVPQEVPDPRLGLSYLLLILFLTESMEPRVLQSMLARVSFFRISLKEILYQILRLFRDLFPALVGEIIPSILDFTVDFL